MTDPAPVDIRRRRREAVADEIERVAIALFIRHGLQEVTVDAIAAAAGVSPRTFFRYFPSKNDVLRAHQRRLADRFLRALGARPPGEGAWRALRGAFVSTSSFREEDRDQVVLVGRMLATDPEAFVAGGYDRERRARLHALVAQRLAVTGPHDLRATLLANVALATAHSAFTTWLEDPDAAPLESLMAEAFDLVEAGLTRLDEAPPTRRERPGPPS